MAKTSHVGITHIIGAGQALFGFLDPLGRPERARGVTGRLKKLPLFSDLDDAGLEQLESLSRVLELPRKSRIYTEGVKVWLAGGAVLLALAWPRIPKVWSRQILAFLVIISAFNTPRAKMDVSRMEMLTTFHRTCQTATVFTLPPVLLNRNVSQKAPARSPTKKPITVDTPSKSKR